MRKIYGWAWSSDDSQSEMIISREDMDGKIDRDTALMIHERDTGDVLTHGIVYRCVSDDNFKTWKKLNTSPYF